jgi:3-oxoacyl-[acyl-carrier protein] reductase
MSPAGVMKKLESTVLTKGIAIIGATGGLGEAVVRMLGRRVPLSIGYASNQDKAASLAAGVQQGGGAAAIGQVDMRQAASVKAFIDAAAARWGGLDAVVSMTGPPIPLLPLVENSEEDFKRVYEIDVFGSFNILKAASASLKASGGGAIVLCLTTAVLRTLELDGLSGGPKTAVAAMIRQVAREMGHANVRVNGIAPGVIDAGIVHTLLDSLTGPAKQLFDTCVGNTPLGRMGRPEEISALIDFLTSPGASYISGQIIGVDGGHSA